MNKRIPCAYKHIRNAFKSFTYIFSFYENVIKAHISPITFLQSRSIYPLYMSVCQISSFFYTHSTRSSTSAKWNLIWNVCHVTNIDRRIPVHMTHKSCTTQLVHGLLSHSIKTTYLVRCQWVSQLRYIDGLGHGCCNSRALAMELLQSCPKPWICCS